MAYNEHRRGSRGRGSKSGFSRIRGASRGGRGGSRGLGSGGSRGRGRGKPIFDSSRIAQAQATEKDKEQQADSLSEDEEIPDQETASSDENDGDLPASHSYATLMQSLTAENRRQAKRRKLDHFTETDVTEITEEAVQEDRDFVADFDAASVPEEPPETTSNLHEADDELDDALDPFEMHFANPDGELVSTRLNAIQQTLWTTNKLSLPGFEKVLVGIPQSGDSVSTILHTISGPIELKLKGKLADVMAKQRPLFGTTEKSVAPFLFRYQDLLFCERSTSNAEDLRRLVCLHAVNHVLKTRDRVIKNNARIAKETKIDDLELRDQGFTRPKVLMLLPTRQSCAKMVNMITTLCEPDMQENRKRFEDSYVDKQAILSDEKPEDFRELFSGNDDDRFRLGLKFTRKTIKYFSQFYNSDIIFASPLGLRNVLEGTEKTKSDSDFLSSVEMVIADQADSLTMQNWEHVEYIFERLNLQPKETHGCDFSRVRGWYLDNQSKFFRQTIAFSAFNTPELNTLFYNKSENWAGKVKISKTQPGAIQELGLKIKQTFSRLNSPSFSTDADMRFNYFTTVITPSLTRHIKDTFGTMIFIPSYFDFVRVRNYFANSDATKSISFASISEYNEHREDARARSHFFTGRHNVLLYTERAHHFRRYRIRGVKKIIMYGLPDNPTFYKELVGDFLNRSIQEGKLRPGEGGLRAVFSKWDILKLERIVGTERIGKMIQEKGDTFDFL